MYIHVLVYNLSMKNSNRSNTHSQQHLHAAKHDVYFNLSMVVIVASTQAWCYHNVLTLQFNCYKLHIIYCTIMCRVSPEWWLMWQVLKTWLVSSIFFMHNQCHGCGLLVFCHARWPGEPPPPQLHDPITQRVSCTSFSARCLKDETEITSYEMT